MSLLDEFPPSNESLGAYLAGEATGDERGQVERWLAEDPARVTELETIREGLRITRRAPVRGDVGAFLARFETEVVRETREGAGQGKRGAIVGASRGGIFSKKTLRRVIIDDDSLPWGKKASGHTPWLGRTVVLTSVALAVILWFQKVPVQRETDVVYHAGMGQHLHITLRDKSRIDLAAGSTLRVNQAYGPQKRTVDLRGEAYFDVRNADGVPFIVHSPTAQIRVLGTQFDVRAYPADHTTRITVLSGKVSVTTPKTHVLLPAGTVAVITDSAATVSQASDARGLVWINGRLVFDDTPVGDVLTTAGAWYGYRFIVVDSALAAQRLTAVFKISAPAEALETMRRLLHVTMTFQGNVVTLSPVRDVYKSSSRRAPASNGTSPFTMEVGR